MNPASVSDRFASSWRLVLPTMYPKGVIPLADVAEPFFGIKSLDHANQQARANALPVPALKVGGNKSPWVIAVDDFIALIDRRATEARELWNAQNKEIL